MTEETKVENTNTGDTTQVDTKVEAGETAKVETKVETKEVKVAPSQEDIDNAVFAALRKKDVETAKKLLQADKPAEVDMSQYVEKEKFDELFKRIEDMAVESKTNKLNADKQLIIAKHNISEEDAKLYDDDDLELFEKRLDAISSMNNVQTRRAALKSDIPEDLKDNEMAMRLLRKN